VNEELILILGDPPDGGMDLLRSSLERGYRVQQAEPGQRLDDAAFLVAVSHSLDAGLLDGATRLRGIVRLGHTQNDLDETELARRGIPLRTVDSLSLITVAEQTIMLMLLLFKRFLTAERDLRAGVRTGGVAPQLTTQSSYAFNWIGLAGFAPLYRKRIGLVGMGTIARHVATRLRAFGCDVLYTKRSRLSDDEEQELGVRFLPLDELLSTADCVSLHHRFHGEAQPFMGRREFELMPLGSYFVNTARGRLVDEAALIAALESGRLAGAALDVFQYEPLPMDSPLLSAPNLILTPHVGGIPSHEAALIEFGEAAAAIRSFA
jgi:glyoxylate reductase